MKGGGRIIDVDVDDQFHNRNGLYSGDITDHINCKTYGWIRSKIF